jgi:cephalosporin-C deacetylase-like acetyl esterase
MIPVLKCIILRLKLTMPALFVGTVILFAQACAEGAGASDPEVSGVQSAADVSEPAVQVLFNPALEGGVPELMLFPRPETGHPVPVWVRAYVLDEDDRPVTRAEQVLTVDDTLRYVLPVEEGREFVGVAVLPDRDAARPWFEFRALYLGGAPVLEYDAAGVTVPPDDFQEYWDEARERLAGIPVNPRIEPVPDFESETGRLYRITLQSWDDIDIVGWYVVPVDADPLDPAESAQRYPAIQIMPGWGAEQPPMDRTADGFVTFSLNPRSHGPSKAYFETPVAHHLWNIDRPEEYYYRAAYMDGVRGLDFLSDRPEVDPLRIAVEGGSQGGAFALALAGLDARVAAAVANVPYISNIPDYIRLSTGGSGASFLERIKDPETGEAAARSLAYIDVANLAYSISAPTQIIVGVQDRVTPPLNGVVAYNRIPDGVPAELLREFTAGHEISPFMRQSNRRWYETHLR